MIPAQKTKSQTVLLFLGEVRLKFSDRYGTNGINLRAVS